MKVDESPQIFREVTFICVPKTVIFICISLTQCDKSAYREGKVFVGGWKNERQRLTLKTCIAVFL